MARPTVPASLAGSMSTEVVSGNRGAVMASAAIFKPQKRTDPQADRNMIAQPWQVEAYRQINICGEARYAATLFAAMSGRAEIGVSEPNSLGRKATWVKDGPEVEAFNEIAPTVRERSRLIRDYMLHRIVGGECYLIARERLETDPGYVEPPSPEELDALLDQFDPFDPNAVPPSWPDRAPAIWEIVGVTELQKSGDGTWKVKHDNNNYVPLGADDPIIRMWWPDPSNRREAWSPFRSLLPTLKEIEWLTAHIFAQVKSRLVSSGVWFLPENLTFPPPPPDSVEGGAEAIAQLNEAEQFAMSLAASSMSMLDATEVSFPSIVMADAAALESIDQKKLIQFWSDIDDKAMILRSDAVRRFALGMDLPPEQVLGSSGLAVTGAGGSAGSVNHWGVWANEEQTISAHIEPALDDLVAVLTTAVLRVAVEGTDKVIAYDTATLRLRQDRSKEALEWYDRGVLKATVALRETGFDPENDMMSKDEHKIWILNKIVSGSASPEQMQAAFLLLTGKDLPVVEGVSGNQPDEEQAKGVPGQGQPPALDQHPYEGPPREQHDHSDAPFSVRAALCEALVLRALEKAGNKVLNSGKRGRDKDRSTPAHLAHLTPGLDLSVDASEFDFSMASTMLGDLPAAVQQAIRSELAAFCARLYEEGEPYTRAALIPVIGAL